MRCLRCGSDELHRIARRGAIDHLLALLGRWPYRCDACQNRCLGRRRSLPLNPRPEARVSFGEQAGAAFRTSGNMPTAKVLIAAHSHEQLDEILLALDRAVTAYDRKAKRQAGTRATSRTSPGVDRVFRSS